MEKQIERALVKAVRKIGGMAIKLNTLSLVGMPDRLVLLPKGLMCFVELKDKGQKPRPIQLKRHRELRKLGFKIYVIDETSQIESLIKELKNNDL